MFWKKNDKEKQPAVKGKKTQTVKNGKQPVVKSTKQSAVKSTKQSAVKSTKQSAAKSTKPPAPAGEKTQDMSDKVLTKLMEIEREARLEKARDSVDGLEDEKIAGQIELLLKIMQSGE